MDYTVKEGDTLSDILYNLTGDGSFANYNEVAQNNNIANADNIQVGQVIHIDESKLSESTSANANQSESSTNTNNSNSPSYNVSQASGATQSPRNATTSRENENSTTGINRAYTENDIAESYATPTNTNKSATSTVEQFSSTSMNNSSTQKEPKTISVDSRDAKSPSTGATPVTTSSPSSSGAKYRFTTTIEDDDDIVMDIDAASAYIEGTMDADLGEMCRNLITLIQDLTTMQGRQYSTTGTAVDEDYKDFEAITEALSNFLTECNMILDQIVSYINSCYLTLNN